MQVNSDLKYAREALKGEQKKKKEIEKNIADVCILIFKTFFQNSSFSIAATVQKHLPKISCFLNIFQSQHCKHQLSF